METEMLIALIAGGTGVVLGLLSLMMSLVVRFSAARAAQDVERLRQEITQRHSSEWMKDQELETTLTPRRMLSESIQRIKDEVTRLLNTAPDAPTPREVHQSVSDAGRLFSKLVDEHGSKLGDAEKRVIILARESSVQLVVEVRRVLEHASTNLDMTHKDREVITLLRTDLTEAQSILRARMVDRLIGRTLSDLKGGK